MKKATYDTTKYQIRNWKNAFTLHWIINPVLVFNELVLGQRIPKLYLKDLNIKTPAQEKFKIPCPHCLTTHPASKWSIQNNTTFSNWFGLYCDQCSQIIPCVTNLTSYVLLGISFPIRYWFKDQWKATWLKKQGKRFENLQKNALSPKNSSWLKMGLSWGSFMFLVTTILVPLFMKQPVHITNIIIAIPIWTLSGLAFVFFIKLISRK